MKSIETVMKMLGFAIVELALCLVVLLTQIFNSSVHIFCPTSASVGIL